MTRIATPPDYNPTTERFARSMGDGRLCDADRARAIFKAADVCRYGALWWACAALLATLAVIVIVATA